VSTQLLLLLVLVLLLQQTWLVDGVTVGDSVFTTGM
jgi:hypothetical protein